MSPLAPPIMSIYAAVSTKTF